MDKNTTTIIGVALVVGLGVLVFVTVKQAKALQQLSADVSRPASQASDILGRVQEGIGLAQSTLTNWLTGRTSSLPDHQVQSFGPNTGSKVL